MRFGLIGFGAWGQLHASAMQRIADIELTAICCRSDAAAGIAKETYPDAVIYRDWQSLVEANDVEAVSIVVPNHLHAEISIAALNAGKDVQGDHYGDRDLDRQARPSGRLATEYLNISVSQMFPDISKQQIVRFLTF